MPRVTRVSRWLAVLAVSTCVSQGVAAQPRSAPPTLSRGWAAIEARQFAEAVAIADAALKAYPRSHPAIVLKIAGLAGGGQTGDAFETYKAWVSGRQNDDQHLLGMIAEGVLRGLGVSGKEVAIRVRALETLAAAGDQSSLDALARLGAAGGLTGQEALASLGDENAMRAIAAEVQTASGSRQVAAIEAAGRVHAPGAVAAIRPLLGSPDAAVRAAAADALGQLRASDTADALVPLLSDEMPDVRRGAAIALREMGRLDGDVVIAGMLGSGVPDVVLGIAEGMPDDVSRWAPAVEPLLRTENPIDRLRAARLLKNTLPDASRAVLNSALADENVAVREEAGRALGEMGVAQSNSDWPALLTDSSPWVRVEAARALFQNVSK